MELRNDITVVDEGRAPRLIVEVKGKRHAPIDWAVQLRRNLLSHGFAGHNAFFLLALPDRFYLWKPNAKSSDLNDQPTCDIDAEPILRRYFEDVGIAPNEARGEALELIVGHWLEEFMRVYRERPDQISPSEQWLIESGLAESIKNGTLQYGALA